MFAYAGVGLATGAAALALLALTPFLEKRYAARFRCIVWLALAVRLLFPFTSNLPVVLHLVREPFLTRCSKTAAACSEGLFSCSDFGYCTLRMSEKQVFHIRHIRFYYVIDKEYTD